MNTSGVSSSLKDGKISDFSLKNEESSGTYRFFLSASTASTVFVSAVGGIWKQATRGLSEKYPVHLAGPAAGFAYLLANRKMNVTPSLKEDMKLLLSSGISMTLEDAMPSASGTMGCIAAATKGAAIGVMGSYAVDNAPHLAASGFNAAKNWWWKPSNAVASRRDA